MDFVCDKKKMFLNHVVNCGYLNIDAYNIDFKC